MAIDVLLIDDTEETLTTLEMMYESNGQFRVVGKAYNAREAIDFITHNKVDFASVDFQLGKDDGIDLCEKLHKLSPNTFMVMCTVMANEATRERARAAGIHDFVGKPMTLRELNDLYTTYKSFRELEQHVATDELPEDLRFLTDLLGQK